LQQLPRVAQQGLNLISLGDCDLCEGAVLARAAIPTDTFCTVTAGSLLPLPC
jgi:hypothetical protein